MRVVLKDLPNIYSLIITNIFWKIFISQETLSFIPAKLASLFPGPPLPSPRLLKIPQRVPTLKP